MAHEIKTLVVDRPGVAPRGENVVLVGMRPVVAILVRVARTYAQSVLGFLAVLMVTDTLPAGDFQTVLTTAASWAVAPAAISLIQNVAELLARVDESLPEARG